VAFVDISAMKLTGWWNRMALFEPQWRGRSKIIFLDLNTTVVGPLLPLWNVPGEFAIYENDPRMTGHPGKYNSSVMVIGGGMAGFVWSKFDAHRVELRRLRLLAGRRRRGSHRRARARVIVSPRT